MYGQPGSKLEKCSKTFGRDVFVGHIHYPGIRFGCYSVGLTGELDQNYNEANASNWMHGFGFCNQYNGVSFPTTIGIADNKCIIDKKMYKPRKKLDNWSISKYNAKLTYDMK